MQALHVLQLEIIYINSLDSHKSMENDTMEKSKDFSQVKNVLHIQNFDWEYLLLLHIKK